VCAMNPSDEGLSKALRELAAASPQGAPPELGVRLKGTFERHHSRRRRKRIALMTGLAVCLVISITWLRVGKQSHPATVATGAPHTVQPSAVLPPVIAHATRTVTAPAAGIAPATRAKVRAKTTLTVHGAGRVTSSPAIAAIDFVALPSFDPAIPIGQSRMVRLELPGSALQLIGYPVNEELWERRVLTDVLVGQDGTPYAVRLVQTRVNH
jgi:hypothetical protein